MTSTKRRTRADRGRPRVGVGEHRTTLAIAITDRQLEVFRIAAGLVRLDVSAWLREVALRACGRADLGLAGVAAQRAAELAVLDPVSPEAG